MKEPVVPSSEKDALLTDGALKRRNDVVLVEGGHVVAPLSVTRLRFITVL